MLPTQTAVKIDEPGSDFHGAAGFIKHNPNSGIIGPCSEHSAVHQCRQNDCEDAEQLPEGWYAVILDPMKAGGFAHCVEWFSEDNLVINGC